MAQRRFDDARVDARHALRHFYEAGDVSGVTLVLDDLAIVAVANVEAKARVDSQLSRCQLVDGAIGLPQAGATGEDFDIEEP